MIKSCSVKFQLGLYDFYKYGPDESMSPDEFYVCIDKSLRSICSEGHIDLNFIEPDGLEDFKDTVARTGISFETFKEVLIGQCEKLANIFQESYNFVRTLSTHIIDNPFPVIAFLQPGNLFLGKYEIISKPSLINDISSIYKRKYKHALLNVKAMIGEENKLTFELIYLTGINGDKSFRQNYFREIVLKKKLLKEEWDEFGELPGGILYKQISELEALQMTLAEYFELKKVDSQEKHPFNPLKHNIICMNEVETINLGLRLLEGLEVLHQLKVKHSNINPSSIYLIEQDIHKLAFLDLELAIWDPVQILGSDNPYFQQLEGDKYDTTFRDEDYLAPEHKEYADEYQTTGVIPKKNIGKKSDLYSIGAILFTALTGKPPNTFTEDTVNLVDCENAMWECPKELEGIIMSNGMAKFLTKILAKNPHLRYKDTAEARNKLVELKNFLAKIPKPLMKSLEHHSSSNVEISKDEYILDLHESVIDEFCLEYLYKFIVESNIPQIRLLGNAVFPIRNLRENLISKLSLQNQNIHAEELKLLSFFIKINSSLEKIDLSKNPLLQKHLSELVETENQDFSSQSQTLNNGFEDFLKALDCHSHLKSFELAQVDLGPHFAELLCRPLSKNRGLRRINLAGCALSVLGVKYICEMAASMISLKYINLSSNNCGDEGAGFIAKLIETNHHIQEIDLFRNSISKTGGQAIGNALTHNFIIHKLSIGDNYIEDNEKNLILQSVMFNTQYEKLKATNERFGEFGYNLMAESIKRWTEKSKFVLDKLKARLQQCEDKIDKKLAELLLGPDGELNLQPLL